MQVKQQYEIIVFPKIFTIMNFYSKGLYNLEISLTALDQSTGTFVKGFPYFVQGSGSVKTEDKKAKIIMKEGKVAFASENFYVTFSAQNFYFHTLPHFKLQLERQKRYKIWLEFNLVLTQFRISKSSTKDSSVRGSGHFLALGSIDEKIVVVDSRKFYLNSLGDLNTYQRVVFSEPDYFSYTDAYIFSMKMGTLLRPHQISLHDFHTSPIEERSRLHLMKSEQLKSLINGLMSGSSVQIKNYFSQSIVAFYRYMVQKPIQEYKKLAQIYQHFRAMMVTMNNSTIISNITIPFLDDIGKSILSEGSEQQKSQLQLKSLIQDYYQTESEAELYVEIMHEADLISKNKKWLFDQLCSLLVNINFNVFQLLAGPVVKQNLDKKQRKFIFFGDIQKQKETKHNEFLLFRNNYCQHQQIVQDIDMKHPFIMLEGYEETIPQNMKREGLPTYVIDNLVVFVHGYQGSDFDLELAKYNLEMYNSHCYCLMSTSIQDQMDESIEYLGVRLATEIRDHIRHSYNSYKRINFVGYSLGGILVREAMKHLEEYKEKMNIFLSLASPHAGTIDGANILIKTGIWYLINFQNAKNLKQLHCQFDGKEQENFVLKKLSECDTLQWFKKFIVASSQQDSFVPYSSSRIDSIQSSSITKVMCQNIKKRIKKLQRVQVWFDVAAETGTLDKMLGRKAHIEFLQNKVFLHSLFKLYANQF